MFLFYFMLLKHNKCQMAGVACFIKISEFGGQESIVLVALCTGWLCLGEGQVQGSIPVSEGEIA